MPSRPRSSRSAPRHPQPVFQQGDLSARAGVQRVGRLRQAAFRGPGQRRPVRGCAQPGGAGVLRQGRQDPDHPRQRHRHERRRGRGPPGHHRQERHARIHGPAGGRPEEGRAADRPVRRGLLLGLHRRRPHHRREPSRRPERATEGGALVQRGHRRLRGRDHHPRAAAAPTSSCTCARSEDRVPRRPGSSRASSASTATTSRCRC